MTDVAQVEIVEVEVTEKVKLPSLSERIEWFNDWEEATRDSRQAARRDRDYYDNLQWTKEEIDALEERGQPVLVKNRIARKVNFILGEEIRKRIDPVARPRTPQHEDAARAATDALRYVEEEQQFDIVRSKVFKNVLIEGYGGALKNIINKDNQIKHGLNHIEWDRLAYDQHSRSPDFDDAKWLAIVKWMELDDAIDAFPGMDDSLKAAVDKGTIAPTDDTIEDSPRGWVDKKRKRLKIVEMYFRISDDWYRATFTEGADLEEPAKTEYLDENKKHSLCPLILVSCYVDANGNRYGVVRQLISPQDEINKRSSKALHLLSTRQVIAEEGAIADPNKFQRELAKPDGIAIVNAGRLQDGTVQVNNTNDLAQGQVQLLQEAKQDIDTIGSASATLPDIPESASGRAFLARQQSAAQELGQLFDQLKQWSKHIFELDWLCIRSWWTDEKWLRITDDQELTGYRFTALNQQMTRGQRLQELMQKQPKPQPMKAVEIAAGEFAPIIIAEVQQLLQQQQQSLQQNIQQAEQQQQSQILEQLVQQLQQISSPEYALALIAKHPLMQQVITTNQVDQMLVDIIIDEAPETAILAQEEFDTLSQIFPTVVQGRPDLAPVITKLLIKASDLPDKRELLQELEKGVDPQQAQLQNQVQQLQMQLQQASIAVEQTKAQLQQAQAEKTTIEAQLLPAKTQSEIENKQAQSINHAASAGAKTGASNGISQA